MIITFLSYFWYFGGISIIVAFISLIVFIIWGIYTNIQWEKKHRIPYTDFFLPKNSVKRVAVIGGGSSGITAAKECLQAGFEVVVFEQTKDVGGNWVFKEEEAHSSVYRSTFINTSRQLMCYSDYPMPDSLPTYPHHKQIVRYFRDYCDHFGVTEKIRFSTQVLNVEKTNDDKWKVYFRSSPDGTPLYLNKSVDGDVQSEIFDAVMVCNGHHSVPRWPEPFEGQEEFKGQIFHSHQYKDPFNPYNLVDKRVLVVGIGNSAVDIANELSRCSKQVYLSTRSGAWIFPKYIGGKAFDHALSLNRAMRYCIPKKYYDRIGNFYVKMVINKTMGSMESWGLKPKGDPLNMHPTISHELLHRVGTGTIRLRPNIKSIGSDFVIFEDGEKSKIDVIIFCTGYNISYPFLSNDLLPVNKNRVELFNYMISPNLPPTLAIIGLIQPLGAIMPIAEMQSRVMAQIWLGNAGLPSKENMLKNIQERKEYLASRYLTSDRHTIQVDFDDFMDTLAAMIGCLPNIKKHIKLWKPLLFGPVWPTHYRLDGPFAWDGAAEAIKKAYAQIDERPEKEASHYWVDED